VTTVELRTAQRRGVAALAGREVRRVIALWTQTILPPVVTAALFLAVFGGALGTRIGSVEGAAYLAFILPGVLVMTVASQSLANNSTSLFQAKSEGYIEDVLTSPLRPWHLALAYGAGGIVRGFAAAFVVAVAALPFVDNVERPGVAIASLLLTGFCVCLARRDHGRMGRDVRSALIRRKSCRHAARPSGGRLLLGGLPRRAVANAHAARSDLLPR
jgi:hypothetical protein